MGNSQTKKKAIKVRSVNSRIPKQEKQQLKEAFDRIQSGQGINEYQFRLEVLGPQVPESIGLKIYQLFSSDENVPDSMTFEDLLSCYIVFKQGRTDELGQLCFELMKITSGAEYLSREHISLFTEKFVSLNEQVVLSFYAKTEFDPRLPIKKEEFVSSFKKVQTLPLFTWVQKLIEGFQRDNMNMDEAKTTDIHRRLTIVQSEITKSETEGLGFQSLEYENMQEFFNKEIKKNDAKEVLKTITKLFKDIRNNKLRKYFIDALANQKALDFKYMSNVAYVVCKETNAHKKLDFLFDLLSNTQETMKRRQLKDFAEIFKLGANYFNQKGAALTKQDFINDVITMNIDFNQYEKCKFSLIAMMGLKPINDDEEKEAILSALNYNHNVEAYIQDHLEDEDTYYVIEKQFWDAWAMNIGFLEDKSFVIKKEKQSTMNNASLLEPLHDYRMREVVLNEDFIMVPKFVFFPLTKWYKCTKVIERKVIQYKQSKFKAMNMFKQKKAQSVIVQAQQIPDSFYRTVGDITYELEVYPKFLYFEKINDKGEKPHQKAIVNQKIDQNYMKKTLKSDKIPFQELLISRKATFEEVLKTISVHFKENPKRGRLWIEDQVISGAKLEESLDEFGISMGQVVYAEYSNVNNQWPTDNKLTTSGKNQSGQTTGTDNAKDALKTCGLYNLGNTCYMNSALQCLANTKFFYEYFIKEKKYIKQMNLKSKLGHQGELAKNFADLVQKMWTASHMVVPRNFKNSISSISEQFQGYDQQDSQEFLAFLLDGLHEELNLRQEKPYLENPDSDNRKIVELGLESWSNSLRRDWSFIFFIFYGQLKSALSCQTCNKISITFDIFTNIPLSLPEPSKILLNVIVYRLPNEIKDLINGKKQALIKRLDSQRSEDGHLRVQSNQGERGVPGQLQKFQESFKYITNDQPIHISLRVDKDIKISQLMQMICEVKEVNIDPTSKVSNICLYSQTKGIIRGIFNQEYRLTQYNLLTNEVEAIEVLSKKGREIIRDYYKMNEHLIEEMPNTYLTSLLGNSEKIDESQQKPNTQSSTTASRKQKSQQRTGKDQSQGVKIDKCNLFNSYQVAFERYQDFEDNNNFPDEIYAVGYHRRFVKKQNYFFCPYQPQLLSSPLIMVLPLKPTGKRIYEEIWAVAHNHLKKSSIYHNKKNLWWEQKNWQEKLSQKDQTFKPFVLKTVDRSGYSCSQCNWMQMCSGCILPPTDEYIEDFFKKCHLAIEWYSSLIEEDYNQQSNEVLHHSSTQDKEIIDEDYINLEDCLRKFHEVEEIGSADHIYCSNCKKPQGHLKKLEIFRPPPILIIQLKRFKFSSTFRNKLTTLVEFPLYNLDLSSFVTDQDFLSSLGIDLKYDLYGIINHYGTLHFGHYISLVKNLQENKWYKYDDSHRTQISEDSIQKENAYILFYIRKDLMNKNLDQILPNIRDFFPGKPIITEKGNAFIIEKDQSKLNQYLIQYEKGKETETVPVDQILEEKDSNEIHYDAKEMQEIESNKKERLTEMNRKRKNRRCTDFCASFSMLSNRMDTQLRRKGAQRGITVDNNTSGPIIKSRSLGSIKSQMTKRAGAQQCSIF